MKPYILEQQQAELEAVVGLMSAIWVWREWQLEGQCEYIRIELQGMMSRQTQHHHKVEASMQEEINQLEGAKVALVASRAEARKLRAAVGQLRSIARMTLPEGPSAPLANSIRKVLAETAWVDVP